MRIVAFSVVILLAGCAAAPVAEAPATAITPFSASASGSAVPEGWQPLLINRTKTPTEYRLERDPETQTIVLHAMANAAASGLRQRLDIDSGAWPVVRWRWRVVDLIIGADNQDRYSEDSPVRLMLFFDGDKRTLPITEQLLMETARLLTGQELPFSTLMYIWENRLPVGTVLPNNFTSQVKMLVAGSGPDVRLGQWKVLERNFVEDYLRAFGSPPGRLVGVGIMTDTDNTGERIEAFYGDIELKRAR
jgi:Protein of unknown function (DUF3047)